MMYRNTIVIGFILVATLFISSQRSYGQQSSEEEAKGAIYTVEMMPNDEVRLISNQGDDTLVARISKKVDLNFDGLDDLIVMFPETYGNWGDCVYGIYVQKENGKYLCVFQEYWFSTQWDLLENERNLVDGVRWMKLRLYSRTDYGGGPPGWIPTHFLQFDGKRYQEIGLQSLTNWPQHIDQTETFGIEKEYQYQGKTFQVGRMLLKDFTYGPLTLRILEHGKITDIAAPMDQYPDLEMSETDLIQLHNRPFFLVKDRYRVYLIDLEQEKVSAPIEPGQGVEYGDDSISGTVRSIHFFNNDQYLIGIAVSYGPFCFNISNLDYPKELQRYSDQYWDSGQPYFFLDQQSDNSWNGFIAQSEDVTKLGGSPLYKEIKDIRFLFREAYIIPHSGPYLNPVIEEASMPFILLYEKKTSGKKIPWVVDLVKGKLLKGETASQFIKE